MCSCPSGGLFGRRRGAKKTHKHAFSMCFGPRGCHNGSKPSCFTRVLNTRLSRRRLSAHLYVVFRGLGLPRLPARNRQTRRTAGLRVAVTLVWLLGPRGPPEGARRGPGAPKGTRNTTDSWDFLKTTKTRFLKMCTPLECQAHFGQKGPQTERQSRRKTAFFVVALKVARGNQKSERAHHGVFLKL